MDHLPQLTPHALRRCAIPTLSGDHAATAAHTEPLSGGYPIVVSGGLPAVDVEFFAQNRLSKYFRILVEMVDLWILQTCPFLRLF